MSLCDDSAREAHIKFYGTCLLLVLVTILLVGTVDTADPYDFIVVGGGTAGCVIARRLAESGDFTVLLIESGGVPLEDQDVPAHAPIYVGNPNLTFVFPSIPQENAAKRRAGVIDSLGGHVLGGTSALNYMWFNRGSPHDYNNWGKVTGDYSWNYTSMLKYFRRVESYAGDFTTEGDEHGYQGPITVSRPKYAPGLDIWLEAGQSLGYTVSDPNGPQRISFTPVEYSKRLGRRVSSYTGYIKPILSEISNLRILINTNVTEIIFDQKKAIGVRLSSNSPDVLLPNDVIYASKEIIISAGAYLSPVILLRSGIGPSSDLSALQIPVVQDLPVGLYFQDQVAIPLQIYINDSSVIMDEPRDLTPANWEYFNRVGDGPYSSTRGGTGQSFVASSVAVSEGEGEWADLHITMAHSNEPYLAGSINENARYDASTNRTPISSTVFVVRPKSRGTVRLDPKNPNGLPAIDLRYFTDPRDMQIALDGINVALKIFEGTPAYQRIAAKVDVTEYDECKALKERSEEFWKCYVMFSTLPGLHPGGSCRMGSADDPTAVVDTQLRVLGVTGLRVIDASIMPAQTNANTQAGIYAIAEKGAEMILKDWEANNRPRRHGRLKSLRRNNE